MTGPMHGGEFNANNSGVATSAEMENRTSNDSILNVSRKQDISDVLQQIMTITDQSLDEAQAR